MLRLIQVIVISFISRQAFASGSEGMALQLVCQAYDIGSGNLMLMAGFLVAVYGLYQMISNASYKSGLFLIICGALLTALPGLIFSTLRGTNTWLRQAGVTETDISYLLSNIESHVGECEQIAVDLEAYNSMVDGGYFDPKRAIEGRGAGNDSAFDLSGVAPASEQGVGEQSACLGQVVDVTGPIKAIKKSNYGMRTHPKTGVNRLHAGMDISPIPKGSTPNILAAQAGRVIRSDLSSSYGNVVYIESGNVITRYAHMSSRGVSVGQQVSAGQILGKMGTTGLSTGVHLHFEWRVDGVPQDPATKIGC